MDTVCRCGEPWDWWAIRDGVLEDQALYEKIGKSGGIVTKVGTGVTDSGYMEISKADVANGYVINASENWEFKPGPYPIQCPACFGKDVEPSENSDIIEALQDVLGDDVDGLMSSLEDFWLI